MIIVTGALGFIGSCMVQKLNQEGHLQDLCVVDDFYKGHKEVNLHNKFIREWIHRNIFLEILGKMHSQIEFIFHLGARTDTTEQDQSIFDELNLKYSQDIWNLCVQHQIPLVYASSAATYGNGQHGYQDRHDIVDQLQPLNPYGISKNDFDRWVLQQEKTPPFWAGLKFFNVYGPNEYHKKRMASVIFHAVQQIRATGELKLFRSHKAKYKDGEQMRDFIYVKDVIDVCYHFYQKHTKLKKQSGLYNLGTGKARTFLDLGHSVFSAMDQQPKISFIDTPEDIRDNYQYFTEAEMDKLRATGYKKEFSSLEDGVADYVKNYLLTRKFY